MKALPFYLHVGVHKTATTSLQKYIFEYNDQRVINYLGVRHPRVGGGSALYDDFMRLVTSASDTEFDRQVDDFSGFLMEYAASSPLPLMISDENIYCNKAIAGSIPLGERVDRIGDVLKSFELNVIASVRPQAELLFSLFVQRYELLPEPRPSYRQFVENPDILSPLYFDSLHRRFSRLSCFASILFVDFTRLGEGEVEKLCQFIGAQRSEFGRLNTTKSLADEVLTDTSLAEWLLHRSLDRVPGLKNNRLAYLLGRGVYRVLDRFSVGRTALKKPDPQLMADVSKLFAESNSNFRLISGIDYT